MGTTIPGDQFVCTDDSECDFFPNPGAGPGTNFAQFIGQPAGGMWQVCVGDAAGGDTGTLDSGVVNVTLDAPVPTTNQVGLLILLVLLAGGSLFVLRRKATIG